MPPLSPNARGIAAMCIAMFVFVGNDAFVKLARAELSAPQVMMLRGVFVLAILLAVVVALGRLRDIPKARSPLLAARGVLEALTAFAYITALAHIPIADITALFLTAPLMMTAAAVIVLRESVGWRRWSAVLVGFLGMLMIVKPSPAGLDVFALLAVLSAASAVVRDLMTRRFPAEISSLTISVATGFAVCAVGFVVMVASGEPFRMPSPATWGYLAGAALLVAIGNYFVIVAFRGGEVSVISPFRYSVIVWAVLAGAVVWGEIPDAASALGIALIVGAGLYVIHRERVRAAEARALTTGAG